MKIHNFRLYACFAVGLFLTGPIRAVEPARQWYAVTLDPPSVVIINAVKPSVTATIELAGVPSFVATEPGNRFLYVLLDGWFDLSQQWHKQSADSELAVIDLAERRVVKSIPVGWKVSSIEASQDGKYLLCLSVGRPPENEVIEQPALITVVETASTEVAAVFTGPLTEMRYRIDKDNPGELAAMRFTPDLERIMLLHFGIRESGKTAAIPASVTFFTLGKKEPTRVVQLKHAGGKGELSPSGRWLYMVNTGNQAIRQKNMRTGAVHVIDVESGAEVARHRLGYQPRALAADPQLDVVWVLSHDTDYRKPGTVHRLRGDKVQLFRTGPGPFFNVRPEGLNGRVVGSSADLLYIPDEQPESSRLIRFRNYKDTPKLSKTWKGTPAADLVYLPGSQRLVAHSALGNEAAIFDLESAVFVQSFKTGRGGVKFAKAMGRFGLAMGASMAYAGAFWAVGSSDYIIFVPGGQPRTSIAAGPGGHNVYLLNSEANDVTVVESGTGRTIGKIAVGGGAQNLFASPDRRFICVGAEGHIALIDTHTNKLHAKQDVDGKVTWFGLTPDGGSLAVLTTRGAAILDASEGKILASLDGVAGAHLLTGPRPQ
ncbi:MAG TPA: hypothetical protein VFQ79_13780 [Bryobacteraceae bacterium]|nr:hypothetical protein [Bryobacteraceae bacterium]